MPNHVLLIRAGHSRAPVRNLTARRGPSGSRPRALFGILPWLTTWDAMLEAQLAATGPVRVVARAGDAWKPLAEGASLVVLVLDERSDAAVQIDDIEHALGRERLVLVLPPARGRKRSAAWTRRWNELRERLGELPVQIDDATAIHFRPDGGPRVVRAPVDNADLQLFCVDAAIARHFAAPVEAGAPEHWSRASAELPRRLRTRATSAYLGIGAALGALLYLPIAFGEGARREACGLTALEFETALAREPGGATTLDDAGDALQRLGALDGRYVWDDRTLSSARTALHEQLAKLHEAYEALRSAGGTTSPELERALAGVRDSLARVVAYCREPG
jgi:hypothetical protein